jgi:hypothetical protein
VERGWSPAAAAPFPGFAVIEGALPFCSRAARCRKRVLKASLLQLWPDVRSDATKSEALQALVPDGAFKARTDRPVLSGMIEDDLFRVPFD